MNNPIETKLASCQSHIAPVSPMRFKVVAKSGCWIKKLITCKVIGQAKCITIQRTFL